MAGQFAVGVEAGLQPGRLAGLNRKAIALLAGLRDGYESAVAAPFVISGCIGPRDDAYSPSTLMEPGEAAGYHSEQIATLADTQADLVSALTMTTPGRRSALRELRSIAGSRW